MAYSERMEHLREFGLSEYAARAYLALLELGPSDARSISRLAKVPIAKIYSTLENLQQRGLVRMIVDNPKRFAPVPFEEFVLQLRRTHLDEARRLEERAPQLAAVFRTSVRASAGDRGTLTVLRGRRNVVEKQRQLAADAREGILLLLPDGAALRPAATRLLFEDAAARGVPVQALAPLNPATLDVFADLARLGEVRAKDALVHRDGSVGYALFDDRQALVAHHVPDDAHPHNGYDFAILLTEEALVLSLADLLRGLWARAEPFEARAARLRDDQTRS